MRAFRMVFTVALTLVVFAGFAAANDVTFIVNMSNHATFDANAGDYVTIRGNLNGWDASPELALTDANNDSIWDVTFTVDRDSLGDGVLPDTMEYKFVAMLDGGTTEEWEAVGSNRSYEFTTTDAVVLDTVWYSNDNPNLNPVDVTFAVNMNYAETTISFDAATDTVVARGDFNGWAGYEIALVDTNGDGIYVGTYQITPPSPLPSSMGFKYVAGTDDGAGGFTDIWENDVENRPINFADDTTPVVLDTSWFNDQEPSGTAIDIEVLFQVDMSVQALLGNFDSSTDLIVVRGNNIGIGSWGGETELVEDAFNPGIYSNWITLTAVEPGDSVIEYKFVIIVGGTGGEATWESVSNRILSVTGTEPDTDSDGLGEITIEAPYFDNADASGYLTQDKAVTFEVDARPAFLKIADPDSAIVDVQSGDIVTSIDNINIAGYFNNWPWSNFTDASHSLTDGDGDSIYTTTLTLTSGTAREFIYKYGINGYDVEAGFATNHQVDLVDDGLAVTVIDTFGITGTLYDPYIDFLYFTSVKEIPGALPMSFELEQNYPNPFNPSTTIGFSLPEAGQTMLRVFNVMGQLVAQNDMGRMNAGRFEVTLDASNLSSGVYFYRLESGNYVATKKMMLMK